MLHFVLACFLILNLERWAQSVPLTGLSSLSCNFDNGNLCEWKNQSGSEISWHLTHGNISNGPSSDHTTGTGFGNFLFAFNSSKRDGKSEAKLISPELNVSSTDGVHVHCLEFWFFMGGKDTQGGHLDVTLTSMDGHVSELLWSRSRSHRQDWGHAQVQLMTNLSENVVVVAFEAVGGPRGVSIALDDIAVTPGTCWSIYSCDFDSGLDTCEYTQSFENDFDWRISKVDLDSIPDSLEEFICGNDSSALVNDTGCDNVTLEFPEDASGSDSVQHRKNPITLGWPGNQFLYLDSFSLPSLQSLGANTAVLKSPEFTENVQICFRFWHSVRGKGSLSVVLSGSGDARQSVWSQSGVEGQQWVLAAIDLKVEPLSKLFLEAKVESADHRLEVSVDSIHVQPGKCPDVLNCDFESDMCAWQNDPFGINVKWELTTGARLIMPSQHVKFDHTLGSNYGKFLLLNSSSAEPDVGKTTGRLLSVPLKKETPYCFEFWYMLGNDAQLRLKYLDTDENISESIQILQGPERPFWASFQAPIQMPAAWSKLVIEGVVDQAFGSDVLVDDLFLQEGKCEDFLGRPNPSGVFRCSKNGVSLSANELCDFHADCPDGEDERACGYTCTFENDSTCSWTNTTNRNGKSWKRLSRHERPGGLGTQVDHTTGTKQGYFLHLSHFGSYDYTLTTNLTSPIFRKSSSTCQLSFFTNPLSSDSWRVTVHKITANHRYVLFSISDLEPNVWQELTVPIGYSSEPFQLQITTEHTSPTIECIALDDISIDHCDFPAPIAMNVTEIEDEFYCQNGATIDISRACDFVNDCGDSSDEIIDSACANYSRCGFEHDMCAWKQEESMDDFDWLRQHPTVSVSFEKQSGPHADHTKGTPSGFVLQMADPSDLSGLLPGDKAWLVSPALQAVSQCRMSFYLFLFGHSIDRFNVYTREAEGGPLTNHLSTLGEVGQIWIFKSLVFTSPSPFQIIIEAVKGYGRSVDIAVDDISLSPECMVYEGAFPKIEPTSPPPIPNPCRDPEKWQCDDGSSCVYKTQVCDFAPQCPDESDERHCGSCDFETSSCGWTDVTRGGVVWERANSTPTSQKDYRPAWDHTRGRDSWGRYMMVTDTKKGYTRVANLLSPVFGQTSASCTLTFYYWSSRQGGIRLYALSPNRVVSSYEDIADAVYLWRSDWVYDSWANVSVNIGSWAAGFQLLFRHERIVHLPEVAFVLDDIKFSHSCGADTTRKPCAEDEFRCHSTSECRPIHQRCDFVNDCPNGEDEVMCEYNDDYKRDGFQYGKDWFLNDRTSDFKWERAHGYGGRKKERRPRWDMTMGTYNGRYLYVPPLRFTTKGNIQTSRIRSYVLHPSPNGECSMVFHYHSAGDSGGKLRIYTVSWGEKRRKEIWNMPVNETKGWQKVVLPLTSSTAFRVFIEGSRRRRYSGGVAIDGVVFNRHCYFGGFEERPGRGLKHIGLSKVCQQGEFECNKTCISLSKCGPDVQCAGDTHLMSCSPSCDFKVGMCGWTQWKWKESKSPPWQIKSIDSIFKNTTKLQDKSGNALVAGVGSNKEKTQKHLLISPIISTVSRQCKFSLMYYQSGKLERFVISRRMGGYDQPLHFEIKRLTRKANLNRWNELQTRIPPCSRNFQITVELIMKTKLDGAFFAIDNFDFVNCHPEPRPPRCDLHQLRCADGACISLDQICDGEDDCCDGSDESFEKCAEYQTFDFESGLQGWKTAMGTKYFWSIKDGTRDYVIRYRRPWYDHSKYALFGRYLGTSRRPGVDDRALLIRRLPAPRGVCKVVFWYQMDCVRTRVCRINVYTGKVNGERWHLLGTFFYRHASSKSWIKAQLTFEIKVEKEREMQIIFEGILDKNSKSTLNLDDIIFSPECQAEKSDSQPSFSYIQEFVDTENRHGNDNCFKGDIEGGANGKCLDVKYVCDGRKDRDDGADESTDLCQGFTLLDFEGESSMHNFTAPTGEDKEDWKIWEDSQPLPESFHQINDSLRQSKNRFLLLTAPRDNIGAYVTFLPYLVAKDVCKIRLQALIPTRLQDVSMYARTHSPRGQSPMVPLTVYGHRVEGLVWQPLEATWTSGQPFQLVVYGSVEGGRPGAAVGIDDVMLGPGCAPWRGE